MYIGSNCSYSKLIWSVLMTLLLIEHGQVHYDYFIFYREISISLDKLGNRFFLYTLFLNRKCES